MPEVVRIEYTRNLNMSDPGIIHFVDDLTEHTMLSLWLMTCMILLVIGGLF
jgi:hypothetical protein